MKQGTRILLPAFFVLALASGAMAQAAKSRTEPLAAGAIAPDFTLSAADGRSVTLSRTDKPVVLVFYRGYW